MGYSIFVAIIGMRKKRVHEIAPDEIFLDSSNLPGRDDPQFEGRVVRPVSLRAIFGVGIVFAVIALVCIGRSFDLEIVSGATYADISRNNRLERSVVFAPRGRIYDRTGRELAWNEVTAENSATSTPFALRRYASFPGLSHSIGFVRYPKADANGSWWREEYSGVAGVESGLNSALAGDNGSTIVESDAHGEIQRTNIISTPRSGDDVTLSIDAEIQSKLYEFLSAQASRQHFVGGASVIMDVHTGELLALTSFPEYDHAAFAAGDAVAVKSANSDLATPLLDRATAGLYAPGSIVKPIFAAAALNEHIISPDTIIVSTGAISVPNPYDPKSPSIFRDWTVHGPIDMRTALAVSSDEYFYTIGGGYGSQRGLGIAKLDEYARKFGLAAETGLELLAESTGVIPTPAWKAATFGPDDPWRIGDTYHTAIGQYGFQVTPLQVVRYIAAIANGGKLLTPQLVVSSPARPGTPGYSSVGIPDTDLQIVREGMRLAVTSTRQDATVKILNIPGIHLAAKTGTAQIGTHNQWINSWSVGFWPAERPRYAYATVLEKAPASTLSGAAPGMRPFFEWLIVNHPEYVN